MTQELLPFTKPAPNVDEDSFLPSECNKAAYGLLIENTPSVWSSHCLVLYGPEATGKTHLLNIWAQRYKALIIEPEQDVLDVILKPNTDLKAVALDDADRIIGDAKQEEWLQFVFNATTQARMHLLLTFRTSPHALPIILPDLASRLRSVQTAEIDNADDSLRPMLLSKLFHDHQMSVPNNVISFISMRCERSNVGLRKLVDEIYEKATCEKKKVTIPFVRDFFPAAKKPDPSAPPLIPPKPLLTA